MGEKTGETTQGEVKPRVHIVGHGIVMTGEWGLHHQAGLGICIRYFTGGNRQLSRAKRSWLGQLRWLGASKRPI